MTAAEIAITLWAALSLAVVVFCAAVLRGAMWAQLEDEEGRP